MNPPTPLTLGDLLERWCNDPDEIAPDAADPTTEVALAVADHLSTIPRTYLGGPLTPGSWVGALDDLTPGLIRVAAVLAAELRAERARTELVAEALRRAEADLAAAETLAVEIAAGELDGTGPTPAPSTFSTYVDHLWTDDHLRRERGAETAPTAVTVSGHEITGDDDPLDDLDPDTRAAIARAARPLTAD